MKIQVIDTPRGRRFLWIDKDYTGKTIELTTEQLFAPNNCVYEKMEVRRKDALYISDGVIHWVGTQADYASFCNLGSLGDYRHRLEATEFEDGDEIIISPMPDKKPTNYFERLYWASMMVFDYSMATKLYYDEKAA